MMIPKQDKQRASGDAAFTVVVAMWCLSIMVGNNTMGTAGGGSMGDHHCQPFKNRTARQILVNGPSSTACF